MFSIEEHSKVAAFSFSTETWSLVENGATLQIFRERSDGEKQQTLFTQRQQRVSK